jgi:hypothetical protein
MQDWVRAEVCHLKAARDVWRYCEDSARYVIGEALDPMADRLLVAIRSADEDGLSGTEIRDLFVGTRASETQPGPGSIERCRPRRQGSGEDRGSARDAVDRRIVALRSQVSGVGWKPHELALVAFVASVAMPENL